jgi:hypothetical protein
MLFEPLELAELWKDFTNVTPLEEVRGKLEVASPRDSGRISAGGRDFDLVPFSPPPFREPGRIPDPCLLFGLSSDFLTLQIDDDTSFRPYICSSPTPLLFEEDCAHWGSFLSPTRYGCFMSSTSAEAFDLPEIIRTFESEGALQNVRISARVLYSLRFNHTVTCVWPECPAQDLPLCWERAPSLSVTCPPPQNSPFTDFLRLLRPRAPFVAAAQAEPFLLSASETCVRLVPCNSLITRLALRIEEPDFWAVWHSFLGAMKQCVNRTEPIPAITDTSVDIAASLLHQKIVCIAIQLRKEKKNSRTPKYAFTAEQVEAIEQSVRKQIGCDQELFDVVHTVMLHREFKQGRLERRFREYPTSAIASIRSFCFPELYDRRQQSMFALDYLLGRKAEDLMPALVFVRCCWKCENMVVPEWCPRLAAEKAEVEQWLKGVDGWTVPVETVEEAVRRVADLETKVLWVAELAGRFGEAEFVETLAQHGRAVVSVRDIAQRMTMEEQPAQTVQVVLTGEGEGSWQRLCVVVEGENVTYGRAVIEAY